MIMLNLPLNIDFSGKVAVITGAGGVLCGDIQIEELLKHSICYNLGRMRPAGSNNLHSLNSFQKNNLFVLPINTIRSISESVTKVFKCPLKQANVRSKTPFCDEMTFFSGKIRCFLK